MSDRHYYNSSSFSSQSGDGYLSFSNLPSQVSRKASKRGFDFSLCVVGESGLGKSTLINALFGSAVYKNRKIPNSSEIDQTIEVTTNTVDIEERNIKLKLTVVDFPGYGDSVDNQNSIKPIVNYIDEQFDRFLDHESGLNRKHIQDTRIHCCFYFISPIGYCLKPTDIEFMKRLSGKVNLIPLIAKADCLTKDELTKMKKRILNDIQDNNIIIYSIPDCDSDEEAAYKEQIKQIRSSIPFAISASTDGGKREYRFGTVQCENPDHSDFVKLRSLLVSNMQDLIETTNDFYESYRSARLAARGSDTYSSLGAGTLDTLDSMDVDKDQILKEKELELKRMQEMILKMQAQISQQQAN